MWKRIAEWSAQGIVHAVASAIVSAVIGASYLVWGMMDKDTLIVIICLVALSFCIFTTLRVLQIPNFKTLTQAEYDALKTLGKLNKRTIYDIAEEEDPKVK